MTTITLDTPTPTGTLEELVDRLLAALLREAPKQPEPSPSLAKTVHEARRRRQTGDPDGALAALAGVDTANVAEAQLRWLYAEWLDIGPQQVSTTHPSLDRVHGEQVVRNVNLKQLNPFRQYYVRLKFILIHVLP